MSIFSPREERIADAEKKIELYEERGKIYEQHIQNLEEKAKPHKEENEEVYKLYQGEIVSLLRKRSNCLEKQIGLINKIGRLNHYPSWLVWF